MIEVALDVVRGAVRGTTFFRDTVEGIAPVRLPEWTRAQHADAGMSRMSDQAAGVFLDLMTDATEIQLTLDVVRAVPFDVDANTRPASFVAVVDGAVADRVDLLEGTLDRVFVDGTVVRTVAPPVTVRLHLGASPRARRVQLWLPHTAHVVIRRFLADRAVRAADPDTRHRWVHYGSSISHCADADGPRGTWPAVAVRRLDWQVTNLGFGGQAMLDQFVARTIRELPADVITLKVGINPVNGDALRVRTFGPAVHGFLDTVREGHPDTPIVLISPIACPIHESTPGPSVRLKDGQLVGTPDEGDRPGVLTLERERAILERVVESRLDPNLRYLDGRKLLANDDAHLLFDSLHPDAEGYALMGERFATLFADPLIGTP